MNDFFASIYELLAQFDGFSDDLYNVNVYLSTGITMALISLTGMAIFYYLIDHPRFNKWFHWLLVIIVLCAINFGIAYALSDSALYNVYKEQNQDVPYSTEFLGFSLINAVWTVVFSFGFSMVIKWWSTNCKRTPF